MVNTGEPVVEVALSSYIDAAEIGSEFQKHNSIVFVSKDVSPTLKLFKGKPQIILHRFI